MAEQLHVKIRGVNTQVNEFSEAPEGSLRIAQNVVLDRQSVAETRRGMSEYGDTLAATAQRIFTYQDTLLLHSGASLYRDSNGAGTWEAYVGTFNPPTALNRLRDAQLSDSLFVTTSTGVKKLDAVGGAWRAAGVPQPLDATYALSGSTGFMADDSAVAYRAVLAYTDANQQENVSAPSQRLIVQNAAGGTRNVDLTWYLPAGLTTEYVLKIYRSNGTATAADEPNDEVQQAAEVLIDSTDLSNGYITITDNLPDALRGESLYTNPSQEGIARQNDEPPLAADMAVYQNHILYANVRSKHRVDVLLFGTGDDALRYVSETGDTADTSPVIQNIGDTSQIRAGMRVVGSGIPDGTFVLTVDSGTQVTLTEDATATASTVSLEFQDVVTVANQEYYAASATSVADNEFEVSTGGSPSENIELTSLALVFVVNQDAANSDVYAYYVSGFSEVPGRMEFVERGIGGSAFSVSSTAGDTFSPDITVPLESDNDEAENGILPSKIQQGGAVPVSGRLLAGTAPIKRILALRDAAIIFSDKVYRLSGNSFENFSVEEIDSTARLLAPETAKVFNDRIFAMTDQGVAAFSTDAASIVSNPIEDDLLRVSSDLFTNFATLAHATPYESARRYMLAVPNLSSDTYPTKIWVYNAFTFSWTEFDLPSTALHVSPKDDKLYLSDPNLLSIRKERKSFSLLDFADREFATSITASDGSTSISVTDTSDFEAGYLVQQDFREALITEVVDGTTLTLDTALTWDIDSATVYEPIVTTLQWHPITGGDPASMKHWQDVMLLFRNPDIREIVAGFSTDFVPLDLDLSLPPRDLQGGWGAAPWGELPWGVPQRGEQVVRAYVPRERSRSHWLLLTLTVSDVFGNYQLSGFKINFEPMSSRFQ